MLLRLLNQTFKNKNDTAKCNHKSFEKVLLLILRPLKTLSIYDHEQKQNLMMSYSR